MHAWYRMFVMSFVEEMCSFLWVCDSIIDILISSNILFPTENTDERPRKRKRRGDPELQKNTLQKGEEEREEERERGLLQNSWRRWTRAEPGGRVRILRAKLELSPTYLQGVFLLRDSQRLSS